MSLLVLSLSQSALSALSAHPHHSMYVCQSEKGIIICQLAIVCYPLVTNTYDTPYEGGSSSTRLFLSTDTTRILRNAITYGISSMIFDKSCAYSVS